MKASAISIKHITEKMGEKPPSDTLLKSGE
jgi:hypothetical protein